MGAEYPLSTATPSVDLTDIDCEALSGLLAGGKKNTAAQRVDVSHGHDRDCRAAAFDGYGIVDRPRFRERAEPDHVPTRV